MVSRFWKAGGKPLAPSRGVILDTSYVPPTVLNTPVALTLASLPATNPPQFNANLTPSNQSGDTIRLRWSQDEAFVTGVTTGSIHTITDAEATATPPTAAGIGPSSSLSTTGKWFFQDQINGGAWGGIIAWNDAVAPTITTATTASIVEGTQLWIPITADETIASAQLAGGNDEIKFEVAKVSGVWGLRWFLNGTETYSAADDFDANHVYDVLYTVTDLAGNVSATRALGVTVTLAPDVTAPVLSSPTDVANGATAGTLGVATNEGNGSIYYFVSTSSTPPTATNLKAGTGAVSSGSIAVSSTGTKSMSATGLTASTAYFAHFLHRDAAGNDSNIVSGDGFTTTAATTGSPLNFPNTPAYATGKFGNALNCASSVYGQVPSSTMVQPPSPFTVECWFNLASGSASGTQALVSQFGDDFSTSWEIMLNAGKPQVITNNNVSSLAATSYADGTWHHMATVFDQASFSTPSGVGAKVYIDGTLVLSFDSVKNNLASTQRPTIGGKGNVTDTFNGLIDEVAFWSGVKYSSNFTAPTAAYTGSETNLLALYHLNSNGNDSKV